MRCLSYIKYIFESIQDKLLDLVENEIFLTGDIISDDQNNNIVGNTTKAVGHIGLTELKDSDQKSVADKYWENLPSNVQNDLRKEGYHKHSNNEP